jgi:hypothetical protein
MTVRIYHPYWKWEDYQHGLYNNVEDAFTEQEIEFLAGLAKDVLTDSEIFGFISMKVVSEWKYASDENLSNDSRNKQAWIGQASCCYVLGVPEFITKYGWHLMTFEQQTEANRVADLAIKKWEEKQVRQKNTSLLMF